MTLDFVRLAEQIDGLVSHLEADARQRDTRLTAAARMLAQTRNEAASAAAMAAQNTNWLLALPEEPLATRRAAPALEDAYAVLATDGSSIDVDRHAPAASYVINIGHAWMHYGTAEVDLDSEPELTYASNQLLLGDRDNASKESVMTGNLLDAYRTARELQRLADLATMHGAARPLVGLLDGQFVLWGIKESELSSTAQTQIFDKGVIEALDRLRALAEPGAFAIGSYISRPGGRELTNTLRILACPREPHADCRDCPRRDDFSRPCDDVAGGVDAQLFAGYLAEGERSAIFRRFSTSTDFVHADHRYAMAGHGLRFFYLRVAGGEVARVELPEWVACELAAVDLLHAVVLDQCARGQGYPVVLQEAHEQAVIDGAARRSFAALVEREMELRGWWPRASGKALSKRQRTI